MPDEPINAGATNLEQSLTERMARLERENRWWRGGLVAALIIMALFLAAGHRHRARIDVVISAPPWMMRMRPWGYGPGPYPPPGWQGYETPRPGQQAPGRTPSQPAPQ
jgi:hypothetical protein